jgi:putative CocE/NonD family hydrolase
LDQANYTNPNTIAMRDGVKLFTSVYAPKDDSKPYPIMLTRTPYSVSPYGVNSYKTSIGPSRQFAKDLFIFAYQDVRGRMGSEGEFVNVRPYKPVKSGPQDIDETTDTYDTVDWLVKNVPNNHGKAGQWGISYPGFYAAMGAIDAHPAMKASSPQAPVTAGLSVTIFTTTGPSLAHAFRLFWRFDAVEEPTRNPVRTRCNTRSSPQPRLLTNLNERFFKNEVPLERMTALHTTTLERATCGWVQNKPAVMTVGGWFDAEDLFGPLKVYDDWPLGAHNMLVMGPGITDSGPGTTATRWGIPFNAKTSLFIAKIGCRSQLSQG